MAFEFSFKLWLFKKKQLKEVFQQALYFGFAYFIVHAPEKCGIIQLQKKKKKVLGMGGSFLSYLQKKIILHVLKQNKYVINNTTQQKCQRKEHGHLRIQTIQRLNGRGVWGRTDRRAYVRLSPFAARPKLSQHC